MVPRRLYAPRTQTAVLQKMYAACSNGHLEVAKWLLEVGGAEDVRTPTSRGATPMYIACGKGHLEVAQWLLLNGAANNRDTEHVDALVLSSPFLGYGAVTASLQSALVQLLANHTNFMGLVLPAVCKDLIDRTPLRKKRRSHHGNIVDCCSSSHLSKLRGLETSVVVYIADFVGVVRGRCLRNLREALDCLERNMKETEQQRLL